MNLRETLELLARGELTVDEARDRLSLAGIASVDEFARLDVDRHTRKGIPEVVYAPGKSDGQLHDICKSLLERTGRVIVSGLEDDRWETLLERFAGAGVAGKPAGHTLVLARPGSEIPRTGGRIGILSAGTADVPAAEQARIMAEEMGVEVVKAYDVGVAGVHRLVEPLKEMVIAGVAAIIVAAGMEGALPSVIAGIVPVPVIGLPTSAGYGLGGQGVAALLAMLQSCSPGLVVVNIDNGIGAGATAALIANRVAGSQARSPSESTQPLR